MHGSSRLLVTTLLLNTVLSILGPSLAHSQNSPLSSPNPASAGKKHSERWDRANAWMQTFYRSKDVRGFKAAFADLEAGGGLALGSTRTPILGFFSEFFRTRPELLEQVVYPTERLSEDEKDTLGLIVVYSGTPAAARFLRDLGNPESGKVAPHSWEDIDLDSPSRIDFCWGYFFATGDTRAIRKIVTALALRRPPAAPATSTDIDSRSEAKALGYNVPVAEAAMRSLGSIGKSHPEVSQYLEQLYYDKGYTNAELPAAIGVISTIYPDKYDSFAGEQSGVLTVRAPLDEVIKKALSGDAAAQYQLGRRYYDGAGVEKNYQEAASLFRKAADAGIPEGQLYLALSYAEGRGVPQDSKVAFTLALQAAKQGLPMAQASVGLAYDSGRGVKQNNQLAYMWYSVASTKGLTLTEEFKDSVKGNLTEEEIQEAERQAAKILKNEKTKSVP